MIFSLKLNGIKIRVLEKIDIVTFVGNEIFFKMLGPWDDEIT